MAYRDDLLAWRGPYLERHLRAHGGSVAAAARSLGVSTRSLWRWIDEAGLEPRVIAAEAVLAKNAESAETQAKSA
jgi:transposase-like protein